MAFALLLTAAVMAFVAACGGGEEGPVEGEDIGQELQTLADRWDHLTAKVTFRSTFPLPDGEEEAGTGTTILHLEAILYLGATPATPTTAVAEEGLEEVEEALGAPGALVGLTTDKLWRLDIISKQIISKNYYITSQEIMIPKGDVIYFCSRRRCTSDELLLLPTALLWGLLLGGPHNFIEFGVKESSRVIAGEDASCFSISGKVGKWEVCYTVDAIPVAYSYLSGSNLGVTLIQLEATSFSREVSEADFELPYPIE